MSAPKKDFLANVRFVRIPKSAKRTAELLRLRYNPSDPQFAKVEELLQYSGWGAMNKLMMRALVIGAPVVLKQLKAEQAAAYEKEQADRRSSAQDSQQTEPVPRASPIHEAQSALAVEPATSRSEPGPTRETRALVSTLLRRNTKGDD